MLKLPFKTQRAQYELVTLGNPEIGELELPKYFDLSLNERIFIKENTVSIPDVRTEAVKMARAIALKSGQKLLDVYNALVSSDPEALEDYLEEFVRFQQILEDSSRQRALIQATAIIKFRLCSDWAVENSTDANQIHPQLIDAIATFAKNEESGWKQVEASTTEEDLGNSQNSQIPTGEKSTGDSSATGAMTRDLTPTISDINQPG